MKTLTYFTCFFVRIFEVHGLVLLWYKTKVLLVRHLTFGKLKLKLSSFTTQTNTKRLALTKTKTKLKVLNLLLVLVHSHMYLLNLTHH